MQADLSKISSPGHMWLTGLCCMRTWKLSGRWSFYYVAFLSGFLKLDFKNQFAKSQFAKWPIHSICKNVQSYQKLVSRSVLEFVPCNSILMHVQVKENEAFWISLVFLWILAEKWTSLYLHMYRLEFI